MLSRGNKHWGKSKIEYQGRAFNRLLYNYNDTSNPFDKKFQRLKDDITFMRFYQEVLKVMATPTEADRMQEDFQGEPDGTANKSHDEDDDFPKDTSQLKTPSKAKKRRIVYDKDFLVECFQHPASSKKPSEFPLPNLECTLGAARFGKSPFTAPFVAPKRKEENGKKEKEPEDNISLRPHSGNFSSGCAPNLSPAHLSHSTFTRFQVHEDQSRNLYDRDMSRNNYRFNNNSRVDLNERNRPDRDRERDRDREGRENRDRNNRIQTRRPNSHLSWGTDSEQSDWNRRRNNGSMRQDPKDSRRNCYEKNHREEDQEPEWFSGGPTSQHETIELRGFMDDERRDKPKENRKQSANLNSVGNSTETSTISTSEGSGSAKSTDEGPSEESNEMDLSIEKILKMDHISGILPNGLLEDEEAPSGSSRFSQLFQRNSTPIQEAGRVTVKQQNDPSADREGLAHLFQKSDGEDKSKVIQEMECALRNILLTSKKQEENNEKSTISDMNAFKMLLQQVVQGNKTGPAEADHKDSPIIHGMGPPPGLAPGIIQNKVQQPTISSAASNSNRNTYTEAFSDLFKGPSQNSACQMNPDMLSSNDRHNPSRHHPQVLNVNHVPRKPVHPAAADPLKKSNNKNVMTPAQFVHLLPPDVQQLVANASVDYDFVMRPEVSKIVNALINGEIMMGEILEQLAAPRSQHRLILVGIVKLCLHGAFNLPNIIIHPVLPRMNNAPQGNPPQQKVNYYKKAAEENREHLNKRSGTPVASMSFTPTSVMRKMTAEQQPKTNPPTSQNSFQAFASASCVAPHQAALVNAMSAMNHQGPGQYPIPQYHSGGFSHARHPYPVMIGPGNPGGMPVHHLPHPPYMNYPQPMPIPGCPIAYGFRQVTTTTLNVRTSRAPNRNADIFQKLMNKDLLMMPQQEAAKNNLSDDLTKLLTSGGHVSSDGARNSIGPQHPMALSLEEVEQMQLGGGQARKYQ